MEERRAQQEAAQEAGRAGRRGTYDRRAAGVGRRLSHGEYAWNHREQIGNNTFGIPCTCACPFDQKCHLNIAPAVLMKAHERVYGTGAMRVLAGDKVTYKASVSEAHTKRTWRLLVLSWVTVTATDPPSVQERFMVEGVGPTCSAFAFAAYAMREGVWKPLMAAARAGRLRADQELEDIGVSEAQVGWTLLSS